ncbi:PREDICTED: inactive polyglycylase TTLL10 [Cyprinodon variegatus]|uniref:inactive polyglycylase TTLL10 n=1 Tax=Cyprinodon variegatus TaxID=28743 RepID=UPI00074275E7|nr:PREDICTED: inactive polyglycylase TTLL10 [Cyprinodon variegatus]
MSICTRRSFIKWSSDLPQQEDEIKAQQEKEMISEGGADDVSREGAEIQEESRKCSLSSTSEEKQDGREASGGHKVEKKVEISKPKSWQPSSYKYKKMTKKPCRNGPFYFFEGTNGADIVSSYFDSRGWMRIYSEHREDFKLKWCVTKSPAKYRSFREGRHLMYQIPNNMVLTTKIGLLRSLREFEQVGRKVQHGHRWLKMEEFIPSTYRMDMKKERELFFSHFTQQEGKTAVESCMWICKPTNGSQGRGIFLLKNTQDVDEFRLKLAHGRNYIAQHYIQKPLLLDGRKFDVRSYLLIACTAPYMVFFRHGYVRLTCDVYDPMSNNLSTHLTNQYVQKKHPHYSELKEDTVWSMESFNTYVNLRFQVAKGLPRDWVLGAFARRMQQIMTQCFFAVKDKLDCRPGFFDLIGCDFLVDESFKVWLLEMTCNPALNADCEVLKEVIPRTVSETLDLTLELFSKCRLRKKILPLASQKDFVMLYSGASDHACSKTSNGIKLDKKKIKRNHTTQPKRESKVEGKKGADNPLPKVTSSL